MITCSCSSRVGNFDCDCAPQHVKINIEVCVGETIAHSLYLSPSHMRVLPLQFVSDIASGFTNDYDRSRQGVLSQYIPFER